MTLLQKEKLRLIEVKEPAQRHSIGVTAGSQTHKAV